MYSHYTSNFNLKRIFKGLSPNLPKERKKNMDMYLRFIKNSSNN